MSSGAMKLTVLLALVAFMALPRAWAQSAPPRIFYSDLISGPNTGGEANQGAIVTIWGKNFGSAQGTSTVTVGNGLASRYLLWTDQRISFQLGADARSGEIVLHRDGFAASNGIPFEVRPGRIFFVAPNGGSSGGSFEHPWKSMVHAKNSMKPGDITYVMDGVTQTGEENYSAALSIESGGTKEKPMALVAYPGAHVVVATTDAPDVGIRVPNLSIHPDYWVISGLTVRGRYAAMGLGGAPGYGTAGWRVIGNDFSCPHGDGSDACFEASRSQDLKFYGNNVHDVSVDVQPSPSKQYHAVYFSTDANHIDAGWNVITNNKACRAIQFHSSPTSMEHRDGFNQFDLVVHDNLIHDTRCDGINFATVDPSKGAVIAYNNIIYDAGTGPDPADDESNYAGIYVPGTVNSGVAGKGAVQIWNNTFYNCGSRRNNDSGAIAGGNSQSSPEMTLELVNNIIVALPGEHYFSPDSGTSLIHGSHNLFFGAEAGPKFLSGNIDTDPHFVNAGGHDFHLAPGSPAISGGMNPGIQTDFDGLARPQSSNIDLGAFQSATGAKTARPSGEEKRRAVPGGAREYHGNSEAR